MNTKADRLSQSELESYLWGAATILRGLVDAGDYKQVIFPLLFYKRLSDVWDEEYQANVIKGAWFSDFDGPLGKLSILKDVSSVGLEKSYDFISELEKLEPIERQMVMDELAERPDLWSSEEAMFL